MRIFKEKQVTVGNFLGKTFDASRQIDVLDFCKIFRGWVAPKFGIQHQLIYNPISYATVKACHIERLTFEDEAKALQRSERGS